MYEVLLERTAERDLKKLPPAEFTLIIPAIQALSQQPRPTNSKKLSGAKHDWRIRIGDYRVLYEINDGTKQVKVMRVRHRREAHRS